MRPLDRAVAAGVRWSAVARYGEQAVLFVTTLVLVRLLAPSAFGVFNMAFLAVGLILTLADFGIPSALIHRESVDKGFATSLFWLNMAGATLLAGVAALGAPAVGAFFDEPAAVPILRVLSLGMVLNAAGAIPAALLMRELRFERLARFQLTAAVAGGGAGIGLAATGFGVWSLVAHQLVRFGTESALLLSLGGFRPGFRPRLAHAREVAGYGLNVTGAGVLGFVLQNADNALIGRFLGSTALGYYEVAWRLIQYPMTGVSTVVGRVLFPALARLQADLERFARAYLRVVAAIALLTFPLLLGLLILSAPFVAAVLGSRWTPAVLLIALLAPVGMAQSIGSTTAKVYLATGRTRTLLGWMLFATAVTLAAVALGLVWGLVGVAAARLVSNTLLSPLNFHIALRQIGVTLRDLWRGLRGVSAAAGTMAIVVVALRFGAVELGVDGPWPLLLLGTAGGAITYLAALARIQPEALADVLRGLGVDGTRWVGPRGPEERGERHE